ncbi:DUF2812 domain-containing protein [Bacillus sp. TH22]|uniref:DUF2812 domain-containing protein n=1 Tax=Bacillus mycoides TaxID=1405 RepID=A0A1S9SZN7_BACMY|nr:MULTISPECIES: DUF2812 domain-containing protein [Bacillus]EJR99326.1 hypothetical protein IKO_05287 [Bacillus cereus VDM034]EJS11608.1 hypothetical protein IKS_05496 [Bacillus cereus VDM062]MBE7122972.1 DUF2812 domain-containing protein [Bacillus cereus]MBG9687751.1 hypothetical protein [Bacillus mycoides]MBJ7960671.1 DUF2812 domain-containing protein [Bacillus cereus group sp. N28]
MGETKYITSFGIAFSENKDFKKLRKYAAKGWIVKRFKRMGYELEKGNAEDVIFSLDIRELGENDLEEYVEMFELAGWEYVCSSYNMHLFKAKPGTKPIYTDAETKREKIKNVRKPVISTVAISTALLIVSYIVSSMSSGLLSTIFEIVFMFSIVITIPMLMTLIATYYHSLRTR